MNNQIEKAGDNESSRDKLFHYFDKQRLGQIVSNLFSCHGGFIEIYYPWKDFHSRLSIIFLLFSLFLGGELGGWNSKALFFPYQQLNAEYSRRTMSLLLGCGSLCHSRHTMSPISCAEWQRYQLRRGSFCSRAFGCCSGFDLDCHLWSLWVSPLTSHVSNLSSN